MLNPFYFVTIFPSISKYDFVRMKKKLAIFLAFLLLYLLKIVILKV
ncbi:hypothetical protein SK1126_1563 [Streptococcus mitis]|uniref:Uncharacterized protein n=1 Tax=Streptococcus mitis TaxID=28037 RepID=A0A081PNP3_STRMT|nr:hypothetical protein SK1126_1563 [Streptococcus mitis]